MTKKSKSCLIENCKNRYLAKGFCRFHYDQDKNHGSPLAHLPTPIHLLTTEDRFWSKVNKDGPSHYDLNPCWLWLGSKNDSGYGILRINRKTISTHRYSYIIHKGFIPLGMKVCHSCDIPVCVNPDHLWLGTDADNAKDKALKGRAMNVNTFKTHCPQNHEYNEANTYISPSGGRKCRECNRLRAISWRQTH